MILLGDLLFWSGGGVFLTNGNFTFCSGGGHFCRRRVNSHFGFCGETVISLFGQGERHFWVRVVCFSFSGVEGGGSPLLGENKAFMAEPSDWPDINGETVKR